MGIYASGRIFGIKIYKYTDDDDTLPETVYEEKYDEIMSHRQIRETLLLCNTGADYRVSIYTECSSTLDARAEHYKAWYPASLRTLSDIVGV